MKIKFLSPLVLVFLLLIYWAFWTAGPRVATDFSLVSQASLKSQMHLPQTWSVAGTEGLGEYSVFTLWSYPFSFLNGVFAYFGLSFEVLERFLILIPFLLIGIFSIWKFCEYLKLSNYAKFISTIFYLTNTYILLLIDGGQLTIGLAYAFFPLAFLSIEKSLEGGCKKRILAAFLVSIIGVFDLRFILVLSLLCFIRFIYGFCGIEWLKKWIKTTFTIFFIYIGLNFYWIYILLKAPLSENTLANLTQTDFVSFISLGHALILLSPHWYKNVFGELTTLRFEFFLIPILVFLAPVLKPKNKVVGFWLIVALISIFLTKGSSEPLSKLYPWLYLHVPFFSLFRDSSKFYFLIALSFSILLGFSVDALLDKFKSFKGIKLLAPLLIIYMVFLTHPVWRSMMTGTFSNPPFQNQYSALNNFLDKQSSNVFWIPTISPLTSLNVNSPSLEAARLAQMRPFASANLGTYERFNFLREASYMGELFDVANIGYIVYPPVDPRRYDTSEKGLRYYYIFLNQLSNLPWISRIDGLEIPTLKVKQHQDKLFIVPNVWLVIGSDSMYKESTKSAQLSLSKNALIFAEEAPELAPKLDELPQPKIVLNNKTFLDLTAILIDKNNLIFPARNLKIDPDSSGWWKKESLDLISWRDFLQTKYGIDNQDFDLGEGWAVGEGNLRLKVKDEKLKTGNRLLVRALESSRSGELDFYQEDTLVGKVNTLAYDTNVRWFEVGNLSSSKEITIETKGDINVVNTIAAVPKDQWGIYQQKEESLKNQKRVVDFVGNNIASSSAKLSYKQLSPTHYKVSVEGLKNPSMLIFSQNFDQRWKLNGKTPFLIYSLLNGYSLDKDGQYDLSFEPQKYVAFGLIISIVTLLTSLLLLLV